MKNSPNRQLWLLITVMLALVAALILVGCSEKSDPDNSKKCETCPPDTCDVPPCDNPPPVSADSVYRDTVAGLNMEMIFVKGGVLEIGCTDGQTGCTIDEIPSHDVELSNYYIGKFTVTQRQWAAIMGTNPSNFVGDDQPVEMISWDDAQAFIKKLNDRSSSKGYRLPTNAEWEYAARGGTKSKGYQYSGGNNVDNVAWYAGNSGGSNVGYTRPVGAKAPNELGLYDMSGNVYEWVSDRHGKYYREDDRRPIVNPQGPGPETGNNRVIRGGSYAQAAERCQVSARSFQPPAEKRKFVGFRIALPAE